MDASAEYRHRKIQELWASMSFAPVPVCLVLAHVVANASHGRNADVQYLDELGMPYQCPCCATFVSNGCCGSKDGVVHAASLYCYHEHWGYYITCGLRPRSNASISKVEDADVG